jgi:hypothetical protein
MYIEKGNKMPDTVWMEHGKTQCDKMLEDFQNGLMSIDYMPTVRNWDEEFFLRPMDFSHKNARKTGEWPVGMLRRGNHVLHHVVMQELNIFLMQKGVLPSIIDIHKVPGAVLTKEVHNAIHYGPNGMNALMRDIKAEYKNKAMSLVQARTEISKVIDKYGELGHDAQAEAVQAYYRQLGILP